MTDELLEPSVPEVENTEPVPETPSVPVEVPVPDEPAVEAAPEILSEIPLIPTKEASRGVPTIPQLSIALAILVVILGSPYAISVWRSVSLTSQSAAPQTDDETSERSDAPDYFGDASIEAEAAYVWDIAAQRPLYAKNAHAELPLASLTKLMTGLIAYEHLGRDESVSITKKAVAEDGEQGLEVGDSWNAGDLLGYTMMTSSNDGAHALAAAAFRAEASDPEAAFIERMNAKARELGLTETRFANMTGLDLSESESGAYGSAHDIALLMEHIITRVPEVVDDTVISSATYADKSGEMHAATNTNPSVDSITNPLGSKTGYTALAGGNLVIAYDAGLNHPIVIAVLGSSREGRFSDVMTLMEHAQKAVSNTP